MRLSIYFFRQYLPSFFFGFILFSFVFLLDKLFDLIDLILNKGVSFLTVGKLIGLFVPTSFPLAFPMAILLGCMVTFGRLSEENEITAVRAAGVSLHKVLWVFPVFALLTSFLLVPFNTQMAPWINKAFRTIYEEIVHADPLINILPKKFFTIRNIKIFAHGIHPENKELRDLFVYQIGQDNQPSERIFARTGEIETNEESLQLTLHAGQLQRRDRENPRNLFHATFDQYLISIPLKLDKKYKSTRFRNISTPELKALIKSNQRKGFKTNALEAENSLRYAISFAPLALLLIGIPLATTLKRGGRAFSMGISLIVIFIYYLVLIFGLTMAEKGMMPAHPALWIANALCFIVGLFFIKRMLKS